MKIPGSFIWLAAALIHSVLPGSAGAHQITVYAHAGDGTVHAEAHHANGSGCKGCALKVLDDATGAVLLEGLTDGDGAYEFNIPPDAEKIRVLVDAGHGHMGQYVLPLPRRASAEPGSPETPALPEDVIERVLDRKLKPLMNEVSALRRAAERPGVTEVLGGIGYIVGIMGIVLYFRNRKGRD
jgi:nickel transport protein